MALYMARLNNFHEDFHVETISLKRYGNEKY